MKIRILGKDGNREVSLNRRMAIREKCLNCSGWSPKEVKDCAHSTCPLHSFRTGDGKQDRKKRSMAIRAYCLWCAAKDAAEVRKCTALNCALYVYRRR